MEKTGRRAQRRAHHYIYKTTCESTGRYYVGMHSTDDLDDGYMGSGKRLRYSINKHGADKHSKEILEFCENREELKRREAELVDEAALRDEMCMNLKLGGEGGWDRVNKSITQERRSYLGKLGGFANPSDVKERIKYGRNIGTKNGSFKNYPCINGFLGKRHSEESKKKISTNHADNSGSKNGRAKKFKFTSPTGETFEVFGRFNQFCLDHKLHSRAMYRIASGFTVKTQVNGWTCERIPEFVADR